jgi:NADH-quinone oxidoreductase subunit C
VPDATGLELIAQELREQIGGGAILDTEFHRGRAALVAEPKQIKSVIRNLQDRGYKFVLYELLDMDTVDRISVKARVHTETPVIDSIVDLFPGAEFQEREVFDMFGVSFEGHPDLRRILMPEDYEGHPQRRDFPVGGEPILFTYNEEQSYGKWQ